MANFKNILDFIESSENDKINNFGGMAGRGRKKQDPAVERDLRLSLEECYHGCIKKMKFERRVSRNSFCWKIEP